MICARGGNPEKGGRVVMVRRSLILAALGVLAVGFRAAHAQLVVTDPATTLRNAAIATLKSRILDVLIDQAEHIEQMAKRLSAYTSLDMYAVPDPTRWRSYRYQDQNFY